MDGYTQKNYKSISNTSSTTKKSSDEVMINETGIDFIKGEQTGMFEMGSTIVLVFEAPSLTSFYVKEGDKVYLG